MSRHDKRFPNESDAYRAARDELLEAEIELRQRLEDVAELRRALPLGGEVPEDYVFRQVLRDGGTREVRLSELFGGADKEAGDSLLLYNYMYGPEWEEPCCSCTSIADGFDGVVHHVNARTNLVVVAKAAPEKLRRLATTRGWRQIRLLSSRGNDFNTRYYADIDGDDDRQMPILHVFVRRDGKIHHSWSSELFFTPLPTGFTPLPTGHPRHVDLAWPMWHLFDFIPEGRGDFNPSLDY